MDHRILEKIVLGNTLFSYLRFVAISAAGIFGLWVVKLVVLKRLQKWATRTQTLFDDFIIASVNKFLVPLLYFGVIYVGLTSLNLHTSLIKILAALTSVLVTVAGILFVKDLISFLVFDVYLKKQSPESGVGNRFQALMPSLTVAIWVGGVVFLLDNLGFKISALVAGLGIGGVAVALAASTVLADLFAYFVIVFDRPFVIGDFLIVGDFMGTIEHIGIKTTRIRSLGGELVIFANKDLTDSRLRNYQVMNRRRVIFHLGVTYDTPLVKLKDIPGLLKTIIQKTPDTLFDRAHFSSFGDFNLAIEIVYYVLSADYNKYMDIQQAINFAIKEEFEKRDISFAFPTQTVIMETVKQ